VAVVGKLVHKYERDGCIQKEKIHKTIQKHRIHKIENKHIKPENKQKIILKNMSRVIKK
jgi:hypothetical protein